MNDLPTRNYCYFEFLDKVSPRSAWILSFVYERQLYRYSKKQGFPKFSVAFLANLFRCSERQIQRDLSECRKAKLLKTWKHGKGSWQFCVLRGDKSGTKTENQPNMSPQPTEFVGNQTEFVGNQTEFVTHLVPHSVLHSNTLCSRDSIGEASLASGDATTLRENNLQLTEKENQMNNHKPVSFRPGSSSGVKSNSVPRPNLSPQMYKEVGDLVNDLTHIANKLKSYNSQLINASDETEKERYRTLITRMLENRNIWLAKAETLLRSNPCLLDIDKGKQLNSLIKGE